MDGYSVPFLFDRNGKSGGILLHIGEDMPSKLLSMKRVFSKTQIYVIRKNDL